MVSREADFRELESVRIAKDLFLSTWYRTACTSLGFEDHVCNVLEEISEESAEERTRLLEIMKTWSDEDPSVRAHWVGHVSRMEFLRTLYEAKTASGLAVERIAATAPARLSERLLDAATRDFEHANRIQRLLQDEILTTVKDHPLRQAESR